MAAKNVTPGRHTLSTVCKVAAECLRVPTDRRNALKAKIRHFRNIGLPDIPSPGTGTNIEYGRLDIIELIFALEIQRLGAYPKNAVIGAKFARERIGGPDKEGDGTLIVDSNLGVKWVLPADLPKELARRQSYAAITAKQIVWNVDLWLRKFKER